MPMVLPDQDSLGQQPVPQPSQVVARYDPGQVAEATAKLGQGITEVGTKVEEALLKRQYQNDMMQEAYAKSNFIQAQMSTLDKLHEDPDYQNYVPKYKAMMAPLVQKIQAGLPPSVQGRFNAFANLYGAEHGEAQVNALGRAMEKSTADASLLQLADQAGHQALSAPDLPTFQIAAQSYYAAADTAPGQTPEERMQKKLNFQHTVGDAWLYKQPPEVQQQIVAQSTVPPTDRAQALSTPDASINYLIDNVEGTAPVPHDGNHGASKFGINQDANPGIDVVNLDRPKAVQYYKQMWADNHIDDLPVNMRHAAFDSIVQFGTTGANMVQQAGNDPEALLQARAQERQAQANSGPKGAANALKYGPTWTKRDGDIADIVHGAGSPMVKPDSPLNMVTPEAAARFVEHVGVQSRVQLDKQVTDDLAMAKQGVANPNPPTEQQFQAALGPNVGADKWAEHQTDLQINGAAPALKLLPPDQIEARVQSLKPQVGGPDFARQQRLYDGVFAVAKQVVQERGSDPMGFAQRELNLVDPQPIQWDNPDISKAQLLERSFTADQMHQKFGTSLMPLTKDESGALSAQLQTGSADQRLATLGALRDGIPNPQVYSGALQQIRPDSPVTAFAGTLLMHPIREDITHPLSKGFAPVATTVDPVKVAKTILEGEDLLNPTKAGKAEDGKKFAFQMPQPVNGIDQLQAAFNKYTSGGSDSTSAISAFRQAPEAANTLYQAVRSYYAGASVAQGHYNDTTMDPDIAKEALSKVVGNVVNYNGNGAVLLPWGMNESVFNDGIKAQALKAGITADLSSVRLDTVGDGKYAVISGTQPLRELNGRPVILDVNAGTWP